MSRFQLLITAPGATPGGAIYLAPPKAGALMTATRVIGPTLSAFASGLSTDFAGEPTAPAAVLHGYLGEESDTALAVGETGSSAGGTHSGAVRLLMTNAGS